MANLKEIRDRIVSVKNTRKITEAMRLVAAAKVRRAQDQVLKSRPFADKLARVLENIQSRVKFEAVDSPLLSKRDVKTISLVCITADRGLCGGYNTNIIKKVEIRYAELIKQGYEPNLILVGKKAIGYFQNRKDRYTIKSTFKELEQVPTATDSEGITSEVLAEFLSENTFDTSSYRLLLRSSSSALKGSSNISKSGFGARDRASATLCCSPPDIS